MKLAIIHYHLNPGGVTQVIRNHLRALAAAEAQDKIEQVAVIASGRLGGWRDEWLAELEPLKVQRRQLAALDYDRGESPRPTELAEAIEHELAACGFVPGDSLLQFHNHTLGKNLSLPGAIAELAARGWPLLLQIHDFAEDFRPENYRRQLEPLAGGDRAMLAERLYPQAGKIHYAVLNGRDRRVLTEAGMAAERLHYLPNPVTQPAALPPRPAARQRLAEHSGVPADAPFYLYPVRGIRRKNVGEFLLWAAAGGEAAHFGITLPPKNPLERRSYDFWQGLAEELRLPCLFSIGAEGGLSYAENLAAANRLLTTSVAEGFGMVFLEAWLVGRGLVGRDLPEITADFLAAGLRLDDLSSRLAVPLEWIEEGRWREELTAAFRGVLAAYDCQPPAASELSTTLDELVDGDAAVDFATLAPELQGVVVGHVAGSSTARDRLLELNPRLNTALRREEDAEQATIAHNRAIAHNRQAIEKQFSFAVSGERLLHLFRQVMDHPPAADSPLDGDRILAAFISLDRFHPLRVET